MSEKEYIFVGNAQLKTRDYIKYLEKETKRLHSIIKEVREYVEKYNLEYLRETKENNLADILEALLEILDKVEENK